jgi:hypothetical protein
MTKPRAYMSFGGGVQSTAIAMLAINRDERLLRATDGVLPELYIFADTGDEPEALYPHIADMKARIEASGAKFVTVVTPLGNLGDHVIHAAGSAHRAADQLPFFVQKDGSMGPIKRRCTEHFKTQAIYKYARSYFGVHRSAPHGGGIVQQWLGISGDERQRERTGPIPKREWAEYKNPLIAMNWHRADCINYLGALGITARRSACVYCPFHSMAEWREIAQKPRDWKRVLEIDDALEAATGSGAFGYESPLYLNRQGVRMRDLDLTEPDDPQKRLWDNECAGVCGV